MSNVIQLHSLTTQEKDLAHMIQLRDQAIEIKKIPPEDIARSVSAYRTFIEAASIVAESLADLDNYCMVRGFLKGAKRR
jgi:hypothetical protein